MDLAFSADDTAFREEVRTFLAAHLPADIRDRVLGGRALGKDDFVRWQKILAGRGWAAPHWPVEWGGTGWSATRRYLFDEECSLAGAPPVSPFGLKMVAPVIYTFGSEAQKRRFLPRILASDDWWCQGYSEPGSGSDLASLQARAVRRGDVFVVNGTKTWTSYAHWADWMFCLVRTRTDGKAQEGISFLLIDMTSPGIEVRPIITIDGERHVNTVFLTDVEVPAENLVGEENRGWTYAKFLLGFERTDIAEVGASKQRLRRLRQVAGAERMDGRPLIEDAGFAARVAGDEFELLAMEYTALRALAAEAAGRPPGPEASMLKIRGTEIRQSITELTVEALGWHAGPSEEGRGVAGWNAEPAIPDHALGAVPDFLFSRATTIYGGTNEIQRGIIAKMVLGL